MTSNAAVLRSRGFVLTFALSLMAAPVEAQSRLTERILGDVAVVRIPSSIKGPDNPLPRGTSSGRVSWSFSSSYLWASFGSGVTRYRQKMVVALMSPDATAKEYDEMPAGMDVSYEQRKQIRRTAVGAGMLTTWECTYALGVDRVRAYQYLYVERARRLQIAWHAVEREVSAAAVLAQIPQIAASFRIVRDPRELFAELRDAPRKEMLLRDNRVASAKEMLRKEGVPSLEPGKPVLKDGVFIEWMSEPEARYQLLVPLGRIRAAPGGSIVDRPRPLRNSASAAGTVGWREFSDGEWIFSNSENDYLPFRGIAETLAATQQDRSFVYFYYVATVRVEEEEGALRLSSLRWFLDGLPDVQRRWRAGTLVGPGKPENN